MRPAFSDHRVPGLRGTTFELQKLEERAFDLMLSRCDVSSNFIRPIDDDSVSSWSTPHVGKVGSLDR